MTTQWEKVHVFISSTFNDMHAERDYLIKQVFPELREWCDRRKLRLVDIDLRWGVTEQDALHNKSVVKVCLDRIDDCRPFFLCFLGQRRGWVPQGEDVSSATLEGFPALKDYLGNASVTEMEILHALVNPLHRGKVRDPKRPSEFYEPARHAFFYLRDDSYLNQLPADPPQLCQTYTNEGVETEERAKHDVQLQQWREEKIPATGCPVRHYQARWDSQLSTPELLQPLQCPSSEPVSLRRWQGQWARAGISTIGDDIEKDPVQAEKARRFNQRLSTGRLTDFQYQSQPLSTVILQDLKEAIAKRYPNHTEVSGETDLQKEIDQQEQFLFVSSEGFIRREGDFDPFYVYVEGDSDRLFALTAPAGIGKSTLLANWIEHYRNRNANQYGQSIHFRFIGQSDRSTTVYSLLQFLLREMKEVSAKFTDAIPDDPQKLRQDFVKLLESAGRKGKTIIVLDALNQLESGLSDLAWLPFQLPKNVKLIVSFKRGDPAAEELYQSAKAKAIVSDARPFVDLEDRRKLVRAYLSQYLKDLDERHLETLIRSSGADNPLFLKVVLSELRVFGAFANLGEKIRSDFGEAPVTAFQAVLRRLENDPAYSPIEPRQAVPLLFGLLAHARQGLSVDELTGLFLQARGEVDTAENRNLLSDTIHLYLRQVRPFLARRDERYDFFFDSFKIAARERYADAALKEKIPGQRAPQDWHGHLARYFASQPLEIESEIKILPNTRKISELPYHQAMADYSQELTETLTGYRFMQASIAAFGPYAYIEQFKLLDLPSVKIDADIKESIILVRDALQLSSHILVRDSAQLPVQLIGRLQSFEIPIIQKLLEEACAGRGSSPWLRPIKTAFTPPGGGLSFTMKGEIGGADLYITPEKKRIVTLSRTTIAGKPVTIWDIEKRALLQKFEKVYEAVVTQDAKFAALFCNRFNKVDIRVVNLEDSSEKILHNVDSTGIIARAITPDARRAVSLCRWGSAICTWSLKTGQEQSRIVTSRVEAWLLTQKGRLLTRGSTSFGPKPPSTVRENAPRSLDIWDISTGSRTFDLTQAPGGLISADKIICSPDGQYAVSESYQSLTLWNLEKGEKIQTIKCNDKVRTMTMTPDGKTLIFSEKGSIHVWHLKDCVEIYSVNCDARMLAVTGDGKKLVSCSASDEVEAWDLSGGKKLSTWKNPEPILDIYLRPDEQSLVIHTKPVAGESFTRIKALDLKTGSEIFRFNGGLLLYPIAITPNGRRGVSVIPAHEAKDQAVGTSDSLVEFVVWDLEHGEILPGLSGKRMNSIDTLAITQDGRQVISGSKGGGGLTAWDIETGEQVRSFSLGNLSGVNKAAISSDGQWVIAESENYALKVWDLEACKEIHSIYTHNIRHLILTPDGRKAVASSLSGEIQIWDLENGRALHSFACPPDARIAVSQNGQRLISIARKTQQIQLWDIEKGTEVKKIPNISWECIAAFGIDFEGKHLISSAYGKLFSIDLEQEGKATEITSNYTFPGAFTIIPLFGSLNPASTPDGKILITRSEGEPLTVWDLKSGKRRTTLTTDDHIESFAISPDGKTLVSSSIKALQVWNLERLGQETPTSASTKKTSPVARVIISPDGTKAVSAAKDYTIKVWELEQGKELYTFQNKGESKTLIVSADGQRLTSSSVSHLTMWSLVTGEELLSMSKSGEDAVTPDGKFSLISKGKWVLEVWDLERRVKLNSFVDEDGKSTQYGFGFDFIGITPDGNRAITMINKYPEKKNFLAIWALPEGKKIQKRESSISWSKSIHFTPDGKKAVTSSSSPTFDVSLWNLENGEEILSLGNSSSARVKVWVLNETRALSFPSDASVASDKKIRLWDLETGKEILEVDTGSIGFIALFLDGKRAIFSHGSWENRIWRTTLSIRELDTFKELLVLESSWKYAQKVVITRDSRFAISLQSQWEYEEGKTQSSDDSDARVFKVWDLSTGKIIASMFMDSGISDFAISPDELTIAAGDVSGQVHILRLEGIEKRLPE